MRKRIDVQRRAEIPPEPQEHPFMARVQTQIKVTYPDRVDYLTVRLELAKAYDEAVDELRAQYGELETAIGEYELELLT